MNQFALNSGNYTFKGKESRRGKVCKDCNWSPLTNECHLIFSKGECPEVKSTYDFWFEGNKLCTKQKSYDLWEDSNKGFFQICDCGGRITESNWARHQQTRKHTDYIKSKMKSK